MSLKSLKPQITHGIKEAQMLTARFFRLTIVLQIGMAIATDGQSKTSLVALIHEAVLVERV